MGGADTGAAADLYPGVNGVVADDRGPGEASRYPAGRAKITLIMKPHEHGQHYPGRHRPLPARETRSYLCELELMPYIWGASAPLDRSPQPQRFLRKDGEN